jgi:tRNA pseudouridine55 synthase
VNGVLVVDKPAGPTSHDVVMRLRRALRTREVGHAGTLDPMATGVLVIAVGEATKLLAWLTDQTKVYEATVLLGVDTDTLDAVGRETLRVPPPAEVLEALARTTPAELHPLMGAALDVERARTSQVPPAYSAIQQGGVRAYARARRGEDVKLPARDVEVRTLALTACSVEPPSLSIRVEAAKGYYVRALGRDLAASLGTVGHLTALRRTRSGCFDLEEATPLDSPREVLASRVQPLEQVATRALPVVRLTEAGVVDARHGRPVKSGDLDAATVGVGVWLAPDGTLVAIGEIDDSGSGRVRRGFVLPPR